MPLPRMQIMLDDSANALDGWHTTRYRDFTGGENRQILPEFLSVNQLLLAYNMVMNGEGTVETRTGKSNIFSNVILDGAITSIHRYAKEDQTNYLVIQCGTSLYAAQYDGSSHISVLTVIGSGLNAAKFRSRVWKDKLFLTNGVDNVKLFDGSTLANIGGTTIKSEIIVIYAGRIWLVDKARPNVMAPSRLEDYTTAFDALDEIKLRDGDGDVITGLSPQDGGMVIFKSKSTWTLYGTNRDNWRIPEAPLNPTVGCVSTDSILDVGVMCGHDNLYRFNLTSVSPISNTHRALIESMSLADKQAIFAIAQPVQQRAYYHIGSQILVLDGKYNGITSWDTLGAKCFAVLDAEGDSGSILVGDTTNGNVYKLDDSATDDGAAIVWQWQSAYIDHDSTRLKIWSEFAPEIESLGEVAGSLRYSFDIDYGNIEGSYDISQVNDNTLVWGVDNWGEAEWGDTVRITDTFHLHNAQGNRISFKVAAIDRGKFLGFKTKWCEVGPR